MLEVDEMSSTKNSALLSQQEITCICVTWSKATSISNIGAELCARLLNDSRTRFRALLEQKSGSYLGTGNYTSQDVMANRKARGVAVGVNKFFNTAISKLKEDNFEEELQALTLQLGAMHFRMKVFFQAENWLCVKNCLLDSIIGALIEEARESAKFCMSSKRAATIEKSVSSTWFKFIQFVIRNMKKGFLAEALQTDSANVPDLGPEAETENESVSDPMPEPEQLSSSSSSEHSLID